MELFLGDTCLCSISVPVLASDATRCEALGPVLISMLVARLGGRCLHLKGDSKYVCGLLDNVHRTVDIQLYNCAQLVKDVLATWCVEVEWIPRDQNSRCDSLARAAVES